MSDLTPHAPSPRDVIIEEAKSLLHGDKITRDAISRLLEGWYALKGELHSDSEDNN